MKQSRPILPAALPPAVLPPVVLMLVALLTAACGGPATYTVETIDGVRYVHNLAPAWGEEARLGLELERTIGAAETTDERYMLQSPGDALLDEAGNIYILDRWRPSVRVYDRAGTYLLDIGKKGLGPGELIEAMAMDRDENGDFFLVDPPGGKITVLASDGSFRRIFRPERFFFGFRILSDGRLAVAVSDRSQDPPPVLSIMDTEGHTIRWAGSGESHEQETVRGQMNNAALEIDDADRIVLAYLYQNRIDAYSPQGDLEMRIDRPLPYPVEVGIEYQEFVNNGETVVYPMPVLTSVARSLGIDSEGRIWALAYQAQPVPDTQDKADFFQQELLHFEVYSSDGVLLGNLPLPEVATTFRIVGDRLVLVDGIAKACVYVYRIVERG